MTSSPFLFNQVYLIALREYIYIYAELDLMAKGTELDDCFNNVQLMCSKHEGIRD